MKSAMKAFEQGCGIPSQDMLHARLSTPEPMTAHTM